MRSSALFLATVVWASIVAGCAPENSLFPIYTKEESLFNERLIGVWRMQESPTETKPEDGYLIFSEGKEKNTYLVRGVDSKKPSGGDFPDREAGETGHIHRLQLARRFGRDDGARLNLSVYPEPYLRTNPI